MNREIHFSSDPHLFHENILKFTDWDGNLIRGHLFDNVKQMNDCILTLHNERVKPNDIWYCLGDLTFKYDDEFLSLFAKFHGKKRLIPGNHCDIKKLVPLFSKIQIWRCFKDGTEFIPFTATHVPIDERSIKGQFNLHGHIHQNNPPTWRHINNSMEATGFKPVHFDELQEQMRVLLNANNS